MSNDHGFPQELVDLVSCAWKGATCPHFRDAVCLDCQSVAILRALERRMIDRLDGGASLEQRIREVFCR